MAVGKIKDETLWISQITIATVRIYQKTYGRNPSFSFELQLKNNLPYCQLHPLFEKCDVINIFTLPISFIFMITLYLLLSKTNPMFGIEVVQVVAIICAIATLIFCGLIRHFIRTNTEFISQLNHLLQSKPTASVNRKLEGNASTNGKYFDLPGTMLFALVIGLNIMGIPVYTLICVAGIDPIQATLQQWLNVSSSYLTILFSSIASTLLFGCVCIREMYVLAFFVIVLLVRLKADLVALNSYFMLQTEFVINRYVLLRRQHLRIEKVLSSVAGCVIVFSLVIHCTMVWVACVCYLLIPTYLGISCMVLFIISLVGLLFGIKTLSDCQNSSENLLRKHLNGFHVYGFKGGSFGYVKRKWKCQLPLRVYCGRQFVIGQDAVMTYLDVLSSNITNAVVLIKI